MISVNEIIIVEGTYDKIKLSSFIDGIIFVTGGFSIMSDVDKVKGLCSMVESRGAVVLTDSDTAGFRIRNFLKQHLPADKIKHAYIPEVLGKERRKSKAGAEGLMGVEGMSEDIIMKALLNAGCTVNNSALERTDDRITKQFLYSLGLSGREESSMLRRALCTELGIPEKISANMLCEYLSGIVSQSELKKIIDNIKITT
ncbi:MAG: DUF4093 domain-containing protein [Clostridia bacterium]|nr:DUF4093 domain-containing protein [Clostridia bacterium]